MTSFYHFVAHAQPTLLPLRDRDACVDLWARLREGFPKIAACILMPNHLHLLASMSRPRIGKWKLSVELRAWSQRFHSGSQIWSPVPDPSNIPDPHHLKRQIRYVHLNPCRAGLCSDPLEWEWSTHRDVTGCVVDPWPDFPTLRQCFKVEKSRLGDAIHHYVSADPAVSTAGTPGVRSHQRGEPVSADLSYVFGAMAIARRETARVQRGKLREMTVQTAHRLRMVPEPDRLRMCGKSWNRALNRPVDEASIQAALKILTDPRCRAGLAKMPNGLGPSECPI